MPRARPRCRRCPATGRTAGPARSGATGPRCGRRPRSARRGRGSSRRIQPVTSAQVSLPKRSVRRHAIGAMRPRPRSWRASMGERTASQPGQGAVEVIGVVVEHRRLDRRPGGGGDGGEGQQALVAAATDAQPAPRQHGHLAHRRARTEHARCPRRTGSRPRPARRGSRTRPLPPGTSKRGERNPCTATPRRSSSIVAPLRSHSTRPADGQSAVVGAVAGDLVAGGGEGGQLVAHRRRRSCPPRTASPWAWSAAPPGDRAACARPFGAPAGRGHVVTERRPCRRRSPRRRRSRTRALLTPPPPARRTRRAAGR